MSRRPPDQRLARTYIQSYTRGVRFSWDARKSRQNLLERGFDFEFATQIFDGATLERVDDRHEYGERRIVAVGAAQDIELTVVYTDRTDSDGEINRRLISARRSNRLEREAFKKAIATK